MTRKIVKRFIKRAEARRGELGKQIGIAKKDNIPVTLLNKIIASKPGETISNPTKIGKRRIRITRLMERRAILARNLRRSSRRKIERKFVTSPRLVRR